MFSQRISLISSKFTWNNVVCSPCHCTRPNGPKYGTLITQEWTEFSLRDNLYSAKFSVEARLEHGFPIEYMYFQ